MKIVDLRGFGLSSPFGGRKMLGHANNLKSIGLVEVVLKGGTTGLGETYAGVYAPGLIGPAVEFFKPLLVGADASDPEALRRRLERVPFIGRSGLLASVASAVDIALWDALGKARGLPVWKLLNPKGREKVRLYASGGSVVMTPAEVARDAAESRDAGYSGFKMRVGHRGWAADLRRVEAARRVLGDRALMVDAIMGTLNPAWDWRTARSRARDLARFSPAWLEEPLHPSDLEGHRRLAADCPVPLAAGEALSGRFEFARYLEADVLDWVQPDATHSGGLTAAKQFVSDSRRAGAKVALHVWGGAAAIAANAHLALACPAVEWLEMPMLSLDLTPRMMNVPLDVRGGWLHAPSEPGLGIRLDAETRRRYKLVAGSGYRI